MSNNLLKNAWTRLDPIELRIVLSERFGPFGQWADRVNNPNSYFLPLADDTCRLVLRFRGSDITAIEPGPAFDAIEWAAIEKDIETCLLSGTLKVGRALSFSTFRVDGAWHGRNSGVQILPPPDHAPRAAFEIADHPFILEFPVLATHIPMLNGHRHLREHRRFTVLLNVLVSGRMKVPRREPRFVWALCSDERVPVARYVQEFYSTNIGNRIADDLTPTTTRAIEEIEPNTYVRIVGHDGKPLRVPADLDESIARYIALKDSDRANFDRATFWVDVASAQWSSSVSASFGSLVSAVEALTERGSSTTLSDQ